MALTIYRNEQIISLTLTRVGQTGPAGADGAQGPQGATGPAGPAPSGTGLVSVTSGVLDAPTTLAARLTADAANLRTALGVPAGSGTSTGTNTGDQDISGKANLAGGNTWSGTQTVDNGGYSFGTNANFAYAIAAATAHKTALSLQNVDNTSDFAKLQARRIYTPEMYNAVGDRTTDDTAAVQSAIDAAESTGGTVYLSKLYGINAGLVVNNSNVAIIGQTGSSYNGSESPLVYPKSGFYALGNSTVVLRVTAASAGKPARGLRLQDFAIVGGTNYSSVTTVGIKFDYAAFSAVATDCPMIFNVNLQYLNLAFTDEASDSVSFMGCRICNNSKGLKFKNSINFRVNGCIIYDCGSLGMVIEGGYGNVISGNSIGRSNVDIQAAFYQSLAIIGNTFSNDDSTPIVKARCLQIIGSATVDTNLVISGNTFVQKCTSTSPNNKWQSDIISLADVWNANISSNTFRYYSSTRPTIYVNRSRGVNISANMFSSDTVNPLYVESSATSDYVRFDESNVHYGTITFNNVSQIAPPGYRENCKPIVTKTSAYTATTADYTILCDATSAAFSITLPAAATVENVGRIYNIKKIDASANAVTIDPNASETIDGATTLAITSQWANYQIQSNGTNWFVL